MSIDLYGRRALFDMCCTCRLVDVPSRCDAQELHRHASLVTTALRPQDAYNFLTNILKAAHHWTIHCSIRVLGMVTIYARLLRHDGLCYLYISRALVGFFQLLHLSPVLTSPRRFHLEFALKNFLTYLVFNSSGFPSCPYLAVSYPCCRSFLLDHINIPCIC